MLVRDDVSLPSSPELKLRFDFDVMDFNSLISDLATSSHLLK